MPLTLPALLDAALVEPGNHLPLASAGLEPVDVPTSAPELLGTPEGCARRARSATHGTSADADADAPFASSRPRTPP